MTKTTPLQGLYAITQDGMETETLLSYSKEILRGGARILQYRDKSDARQKRIEEATELRALCSEYDALFIVNDDIDLACLSEADGVHLGQDDGDVATARAHLGKHAIIGVSCYHQAERARSFSQEDVDYLAFGRFFPSHTKPHAPQADVSLLKQNYSLPVCAIGGINLQNAPILLAHKVDMLAVIGALYESPKPFETAKAFASLFNPT